MSVWDTLKEEQKLEEANARTWPFGEKAEKEIDTHGELPNYERNTAKFARLHIFRKLVSCLCDAWIML